MELDEKSWFEMDGQLPALTMEGSDIRFPAELAAGVISQFSKPGEWIIDPFAGFGTSVQEAARLGRHAIGFEIDADRAAFASGSLTEPNRIVQADALTVDLSTLPQCALLLTSPPYTSVNFDPDLWGDAYFVKMDAVFERVARTLKSGAPIVVEVSNIRTEEGFRPLAFQFAQMLGDRFHFERDWVRCNSASHPAGPGVQHSHVLMFRNMPLKSRNALSLGQWSPS